MPGELLALSQWNLVVLQVASPEPSFMRSGPTPLAVVPPPLEVAVAEVAMLVLGLQVETQEPLWHACPEGQTVLQLPQWFGSLERFTH